MSTLTKLFVVLLFICALLLSASTVVFVNRAEDFRAQSAASQAKYEGEKRVEEIAQGIVISTKQAKEDQTKIDNDRIAALGQQATTALTDNASLHTQINSQTNDLASKQADITRLTFALQSTQQENTTQQGIVAELRAKNDELVRKYLDANNNITEINAKLDSTERQRRWLEEQLKDKDSELTELNREISLMGGWHPENAERGSESVAINAVVKDMALIGGGWHATITVGSAENVYKGMKFNVVNRDTGDFLGILTIESVQLHEAIGRLEGPKLDMIHDGTEVRTQLN